MTKVYQAHIHMFTQNPLRQLCSRTKLCNISRITYSLWIQQGERGKKKKARLAKIPRGQIIMFSHQTSWDNLLPGEQRSERKRERGKKIETQKHLYVTHTHAHTQEHSSAHAHTSFSSLFLQTGRLQDTKCHCCC